MQHITHLAIHLQSAVFADVFIFQFKFRVLLQMSNISPRPGNKIIHREHFPPFRKQPVA